MHITELDSYNLDDAVKFNDQLNPRLWNDREHLRPEVQERLLEIAQDFREFLGVTDLAIKDVTVSGSNAAYTYTPNSDIDLHLVVDMPDNPVYRELFDAKKFQYNEQHDIKIGGADVELYVQDADRPHVSQGVYSLLNNDWLQVPRRVRSVVDDTSTRNKFEKVGRQIESAIKSGNLKRMTQLAEKIKKMRQTGLENHGEFGPENLAFKMLRSQGLIKQLYDARNSAKDREFSLKEKAVAPRTTYGFRTPQVVEADTVALEEAPKLSDEEILRDFIDFCFEELKLQSMPVVKLRKDPEWSVRNRTFGRYIDDNDLLEVAWGQRHIMDVLRTVAHELTHRHQHERESVPVDAGETGSSYENEANARAGVLMRDYAQQHPEYFAVGETELEESASGYIPTKRQAKDPRYSMALTVDIKPGQLGREANKLNLKTNRQGVPQVAKANGLFEKLALELDSFKQQDLFEINMGSKNLRQEAAKTGAIAGMEFEMIVPNVEGDPGDEDLEPDYEYDQRCRSIQDAYDFFYDGDFNSRRSCDSMRDSMRDDYIEWLDEKISSDWNSGGEEYIAEWVKNNVDESEWNPDDLEGDARNEALEEYATNVHADDTSDQYQSAYEEFREENQESYDESDWLDDAALSSMRDIGNSYSMDWPHWSSPYSGGEAEISDVAQEFENAIGRDTRASSNYHSGNTLRPSVANQRYIVEPDGSLDPDNPGDRGLEFVSPPLPIDEILGDLNKVKAWAKEYGCYTNDSTGLHINISVPGYSRENLDFVKLALLMGDRYVLDAFGRTGNTYAKSALGIIKDAVRNKPEDAARLLDKMKGNLDQLATKAIHSGVTAKYTSINTKDGHIEFRSPGGDWLDQNFDQIENTLLRFTVAMSAAMNPDAYREEYLKKLYKLLSENNEGDSTIKYFSDYVAGKIPKAALRSFVKQAQLQRNIKRGKATDQKPNDGTYELFDRRTGETIPDTEFSARNQSDVNTRVDDYINHGQHGLSTVDARLLFGARPVTAPADEPEQGVLNNSLRPTGPGPWEIYNRQTGNTMMNLNQNGQPITDRSIAQQYAMNSIDLSHFDNYGVRTRGTESNSNWRIIYSATGETLNTVSGASRDQALAVLHDTARRNGVRPDVLSLQSAPASDDIPEVPMDVAQNFPDRTDGRNIDYSFRDLFGNTDQASSAPAGNSFSGQWKIMLDGEEVWRFRGTAGEGQADANRIAQLWYRDQISQGLLSPAPGADLEVVPVMIEGIEESFSQGVAEGFLGEYPSIETTLGEATHPDLVKYDKNFQKQLHRDLDVGQGKGKKIDIDYNSDEKGWSDLTHVQDYTGGSLDTNDYLHRQYRNKAKAKELTTHQAKIQALDRMLANHKLPQQIVVYTGLRQSPAEAWETYKADVTKPIRLHLPAYTSTTTKLKVALSHAGEGEIAQVSRARHQPRNKDAPADEWGTQILMMTLPAGLPAASVKKISEFPEENEILLPRGIDIEINPSPTVLKDGDYVWHATVLSHSPVQIASPMQENFTDVDESLKEIAAMPAHQFAGGKDMLGMFQTPAKKHLKPLPGGTDLQYAIESNRYGTIVQIVDPGIPGITRPDVVAVLNLDSSNLPNTVQVGSITVDEDYRGRGLAKALYGIVLTIMRKNLVSGSGQTPGGRRNWLSLASIPGVEVQGLVRIPNQIFDMARTATVSPQWRKYAERTVDQIMELGGQFHSKDNNSTYWLFDVVPGKGSLQPAVRNALSRLYGYDSDNLLLATWTGA